MGNWPDRPRLLMSYAYLAGPTLPPEARGSDILIDSGAFTAFTSGKIIDRDEYTDYLIRNQGHFTAAFALDVIGDPDASLANYRAQLARLPDTVRLIPTWHMGSSWKYLEAMCASSDYVSIGGMVPYYRRRSLLMRNCIEAHQIARRTGTRLHGLGATGSTIRRLPWHSVDSSSWTMPKRMPLVYVADQFGTMRSITRGNPNEARQHAATLRRYGLNPTEFATYGSSTAARAGSTEARRRTRAATVASARSYYWSEAANPSGMMIYLASAPSADSLKLLREAWDAGPPYGAAR